MTWVQVLFLAAVVFATGYLLARRVDALRGEIRNLQNDLETSLESINNSIDLLKG